MCGRPAQTVCAAAAVVAQSSLDRLLAGPTKGPRNNMQHVYNGGSLRPRRHTKRYHNLWCRSTEPAWKSTDCVEARYFVTGIPRDPPHGVVENASVPVPSREGGTTKQKKAASIGLRTDVQGHEVALLLRQDVDANEGRAGADGRRHLLRNSVRTGLALKVHEESVRLLANVVLRHRRPERGPYERRPVEMKVVHELHQRGVPDHHQQLLPTEPRQ
eukprot:CAMPEP_0176212958 /NCGR_PEP_ID=MMETSP0121_2-20121125/15414_1 /TAXON_ID=160619 /ORGANISM="Kryptoperidinium foliaceum, Strain CCMP 1326" /LENGTH=215 /DNA_ID=CAMNT_0017552011 /DNA_START=108 /DNA_END=753 /DNA_ORIENTATION=-